MDEQIAALANDADIKDLLAVNYMRWEQREEHRRDIEEIETVLSDPGRKRNVQNPGRLAQQLATRRRNLALQSPPSLTGTQKDKLARLEHITERAFTEHMPTQEELRHSPPGAVDHQIAWDRAHKQHVIWWKRTRLLLNPDNQERDLCNIERLRPSTETRSLMTDGQINRPFALSAEAKANYDQIDWTHPDVAQQIQRLIDEGKIRVNVGVRRGRLRLQKDGGKVYECTEPACAGRIFSGGFARKNWERHREQHQLVKGAEA